MNETLYKNTGVRLRMRVILRQYGQQRLCKSHSFMQALQKMCPHGVHVGSLFNQRS